MKVINNGKGLCIEASYIESAILTETLRKGIGVYEREGLFEQANQAKELLNDLLNNQTIK